MYLMSRLASLKIDLSRVRRIVVGVGAVMVLCVSATGFGQSAFIDFTAERNYVFENSTDGLLPFGVVINNPAKTALQNVQLSISMPAGVNLGNVDDECDESDDGITRTLDCAVSTVSPQSSKVLDFFVDGPNSRDAGQSFTLALTSPTVAVAEPDSTEASLADGDRRIRGANLTIHLVRDINLDINRNGVPDIDEAILNMPAGTPVDALLTRTAVVDVLFLYTPVAAQYLGTKMESRIAQFMTAANQVFRENDVAIKFNGVGLAPVPYSVTSTTLETILNVMQTGSDTAFESLELLIESSGGDLVVLLHALEPGSDAFCGFGAFSGVGRQGDFRREYHQGQLVSVVNIGPDCVGLHDISPLFATNMGIAASRQDYPNGGTFSFSAGYGVVDNFITLAAKLGSNRFGNALALNRFSNPFAFCNSLPCGVDRHDIANGADAVYSMNRTRHLISAITPSQFPVEPALLPDRKTVSLSQNHDVLVLQTPTDSAALLNEFTEVQVNITNVSGETLEHLSLEFLHLADGVINSESQVYRTSEGLCEILGSNLGNAETLIGSARQESGSLICFIESLAPSQSVSFSYQIQIDNTPPVLNGSSYYHELVAINGIPQLESAMCLPVFANFVDANSGSTVCSNVQVLLPGVSGGQVDLNALPTVTGSVLSVPFLRIFDGRLLSAEFRISLSGPVQFELVAFTELDSELTPAYEARFDLASVLYIDSLQVDAGLYDVRGSYVPGSDPVRFNDIQTTLLTPIDP